MSSHFKTILFLLTSLILASSLYLASSYANYPSVCHDLIDINSCELIGYFSYTLIPFLVILFISLFVSTGLRFKVWLLASIPYFIVYSYVYSIANNEGGGLFDVLYKEHIALISLGIYPIYSLFVFMLSTVVVHFRKK